MVKNIVALGALQAATGLFPVETFQAVIARMLKEKPDLVAANQAAFAWGVRGERPRRADGGASTSGAGPPACAEAQADGVPCVPPR